MRTGVILAGGKGSRIGEKKALVKIKGKPMLSWIVDGLIPLFDDLIVVARDQDDSALYQKISPSNVKILTDTLPLEGPLVGLYAAFCHVSSEFAYVHPVDSPIVKKDVIEFLFEKAKNHDASLLRWNDGSIDPLHAVYKVKSVLSLAEKALNVGDTSVKGLSQKISVNYLSVDEFSKIDDKLISFVNINTKKDLQFIEGLLGN